MRDFLSKRPKLLKLFNFYTIKHNSFVGFFVENLDQVSPKYEKLMVLEGEIFNLSEEIFFFKFLAKHRAKYLNSKEDIRLTKTLENMKKLTSE